jgi:hypothetical protein
MKRIIQYLVLGSALMASVPALAGVLTVPGDYAQINDAVQACASGDTVLVAAGTFNDCTHPTEGAESTPACVIMKSGVTLRGTGIDQTIIDAQSLGRGVFIELVTNCRVENLQIRGAFASIFGAGILAREVGATVEITDVRVTACTDGGVILINNSSPTLLRVAMDNNSAKQGGGLAIEENSSPTVTDCSVTDNQAPSGAGVFIRNNCAPVLTGCVVNGNTITATNTYGGGISVQTSNPTITDCRITNNTANGFGGGIAFSEATGTVENCVITDNNNTNSNGQGGGVFASASDVILRDLLIAGNSASGFFGKGGGVYLAFDPPAQLENCTIVDNACGPSGNGGGIAVEWFTTVTIDKCIIAGSTAGEGMYCENASPVVSCSNIFGNAGGDALCGTDDGNNFSADALFCGTAGKEFNLDPSSPCAPGNHPGGGVCGGELIGAMRTGCGASPVPEGKLTDLVLGNHPNPFNPRTTIFFDLPEAGPARLRIFDLAGSLILDQSWTDLPNGRTTFDWNGQDREGRALSSGVYLYRIDTSHQSTSRRMSLVR